MFTLLTRGSSATWSPDSKRIAFHRSASGTGLPVKLDPGAPATDSVIFIVNVDDLLQYGEQPTQVTFPLAPQIDDDADWSPDATKIVFTRKNNNDPNPNNPTSAEIYVLDLGTGAVERLTDNGIEERSPAWSPDGRTLTYSCRTGIRGGVNLEICVMDVATRVQTKLTDNAVADLGPHWSPDGSKIIFQSQVTGQNEIWTMNPDGSQLQQITFYPQDGHNIGPAWGEIRMGGMSN